MTRSRTFTFSLFCFLFFLVGMTSHAKTGRYGSFPAGYGFPDKRVNTLFQDSRGFIWASTLNGVFRFDGYEYVTYLNSADTQYKIRDSRVAFIDEDHSGYLWFLTKSGDVFRLDPQTDSLVNLESYTQKEGMSFETTGLHIMPSGKIWLISKNKGVLLIHNNSLNCERYSTECGNLSGNRVFAVHEDSEKNTWMATDKGVTLIHKDSGEVVVDPFPKDAFNCILERRDEIWFGGSNGQIVMYSKQSGTTQICETPVRLAVCHLMEITPDKTMVGTANDGILLYDHKKGEWESYNSRNSGLPDNEILSVYPDPDGNVWIETPVVGISRLDLSDKTVTHYRSSSPEDPEFIRYGSFVISDSKNGTWVRLRNGEFSLYDPSNKKLIPFSNTPYAPASDYPSSISAARFDRQGNLWIAPEAKGIQKITFPTNEFVRSPLSDVLPESKREIRAVFEDRQHNLWFSSRPRGIYIQNSQGELLGNLCVDGTVGRGKMLPGIAYCFFQDRDGDIWIGTRNHGLYRLTPSNENGYQIRHFAHVPENPYSLNNNSIFSIRDDSQGRLWIGTWGGGLNLLETQADGEVRFIHPDNQMQNYPISKNAFIRYVSPDTNGKIYVATTQGMLVFKTGFDTPETIRFIHYDQYSGETSLGNSDVFHICHASGGTYIATSGGGINYVTTWDEEGFPSGFGSYRRNDGLPSDVPLSMVESRDGMLWIFSEEHITRFDPGTGTFKTFDEVSRLLRYGLITEGSSLITSQGIPFVGFTDGIISFDPDKVGVSDYVPPLVFTHLRIFNEDVPVGEKSPLQQTIDIQNKIVLTHKQNFFNIGFSALDFRAPENILYAYQLEGFDEQWVYAGRLRTVSYMNLPQGQYTLCVRSTNADGVWVDNERSLFITILPPFWQTKWAYIIYVLSVILIIIAGAYILHIIFRLREQVQMEARLAEMKLRFFTDVSHEIRTPLTLITGPVEHLLQNPGTTEEIRYQLNFISQNARRMLNMVNQVLDLRRVEYSRLRIEPLPIGSFVGDICRHFEEMAKQKSIQFAYNDHTEGAILWADKDGIEKIVFNLLSNAFKFTPPGKAIAVRTIFEGEFRIEVQDQGKGIAPQKRDVIFQRFFTEKNAAFAGSGIGLSLVKELVEKHGGEIVVKSIPEQGSTFIICLKAGFDHYGKEVDRFSPEKTSGSESSERMETGQQTVLHQEEEKRGATVLLVEDDEELRTFLESILTGEYRILTATNGREGLETALENIPDFIVSDVMMPEMDGIEMLQKIRNHIETSHIPFLLLTAKGEIDDRLKGLECGADDYLVKPLSVAYFQARIRNLILQRKQLQELYCSDLVNRTSQSNPVNNQITKIDQDFLDLVIGKIGDNLDNGSYSVEALVKSCALGRTVFFRKLKTLTGMAPVEFIREIRLQNAARLLQNNLMVKEVAYSVGFNDVKYFAQCFKAKYGITPSDYARKNFYK